MTDADESGPTLVSVLPKDAIPSIDDPTYGDDYFGDSDDDVLVVDFEGDAKTARAYPTRILNYHEVVNDSIGSANGGVTPVAVTWCPICGSAVVYDARVNGRTLSFGVSGKLADDDLVLYDTETDSEWKQSTGECIAGELTGERLRVLPAAMTTYAAFREAHPGGVVLQPESTESATAHGYDPSGYEAYATREEFGLHGMRGEGPKRIWDRDDMSPKAVVLGITIGDDALGVPVSAVDAGGGVLTATVGETEIVVLSTGDGIHAFEHPGFELRVEDETVVGDGTVWRPTTGESDDGRQLRRMPTRRMYAFAWQDDHGTEAFYG